MQTHRVEFTIDAPREKVWRLLHPPAPVDGDSPRVIHYENGEIQILQEGDESGQGLVRTCTFRVPRFLLSGGVGRSFECVVEARFGEYSRYVAYGKPLWSKATGEQIYEDTPDGGTRLTFVETYDAFNPILRRTIEGYVHRRISHDNDGHFAAALGHLGTVTVTRKD